MYINFAGHIGDDLGSKEIFMPIYEIGHQTITSLKETTFSEAGIRERSDLQRLLRDHSDVIADDILVISEEFGEWEGSRRRIDLLAIDSQANIVVIELKRSEDGGYMELQALRYAAMVSTMTFERAAEVYANYLSKQQSQVNAAQVMLDFLGWDESVEDSFAQDVRIVLVSADFSKELTTSIMWLNERGLDIRCVRMKPYKDSGRTLVDVQQVIPLPEAQDYIVGIREKAGKERTDRHGMANRYQLRLAFWEGLLSRIQGKTRLFDNVSTSKDNAISAGSGISGSRYAFAVRRNDSYITFILEDRERRINEGAFDWLLSRRVDIEKVFGGPLKWTGTTDKRKRCDIVFDISEGGIHSDNSEWPRIHDAMIDAMVRLETALSPHIAPLRECLNSLSMESND